MRKINNAWDQIQKLKKLVNSIFKMVINFLK